MSVLTLSPVGIQASSFLSLGARLTADAGALLPTVPASQDSSSRQPLLVLSQKGPHTNLQRAPTAPLTRLTLGTGASMGIGSSACPQRALSSSRPGSPLRATRQLEAVASRTRKRRRGRRGVGDSGGESGSDDDNYLDGGSFGGGGDFDSWSSWNGGGGWSSGGSGSGGVPPFGNGGWSEGAFHFNHAVYEYMWFWQLLCGLSLLRAFHFMIFGDVCKPSPSNAPATASVTQQQAYRQKYK